MAYSLQGHKSQAQLSACTHTHTHTHTLPMNSGTPAVFPSVGTNHDILGQNIGAKYLSTPIKEFYHLMT